MITYISAFPYILRIVPEINNIKSQIINPIVADTGSDNHL